MYRTRTTQPQAPAQTKRVSDMARPTKCTEPIVTALCDKLAAGDSLRSTCEENDKMPAVSTVLLWVVSDRVVEGTKKLFSEHYMRARAAGGFAHADRVVDVVDRVSTGELEPNQAKAMLDGLKWAAERMAPKHHSARQEIDHTSGGEKLPQNIDPSKLSTAALKELMAARESAESDE